jgi:hypothetical protein
MFVDTNPFLFRGKVCGAMVRLSATPIVNVTSGGGRDRILCFAVTTLTKHCFVGGFLEPQKTPSESQIAQSLLPRQTRR